jgi:flagellar biosynthesis/type III secretory pathway protein FliH
VNHQPFLASLQAPVPARPFAATLPIVATPPANSPWSPKPEAPVVAQPMIDVIAVRNEAIAAGRAEGLKETAALRAQLAAAIARLDAATADATVLATGQIAEAATTIVDAWIGKAPRFQPLVVGWLARTAEPSVARVNPSDVEALRTAIGDARIAIEPDAVIAPGDLVLRTAALELAHTWRDRIAELRAAIQAELEA